MSIRVAARRFVTTSAATVLASTGLVAVAGGAPAPALLPATATNPTCTTTTWGGFDGWDTLTANGDAVVSGTAPNDFLRLTPDAPGKVGSFTITDRPTLVQNSFSTHFVFQFTKSQNNAGAEGLVFFVTGGTPTIGTGGSDLGYGGIDQSVGIEFDDSMNGTDVSNSAVGVDVNGSTTSLAQFATSGLSPAADLDDGSLYDAWVDYNNSTGVTEVRLVAHGGNRPTSPQLSLQQDMSANIGAGAVNVGLTASTGTDSASHDVVEWDFTNCYAPLGVLDAGACTSTSWGGANGWLGLTTYGEADVAGTPPDDYLEVNPDQQNNVGRVMTSSETPLVNDSFSTHFTFRFASNFLTDGAGGLSFAVTSPSNFNAFLSGDGQVGVAGLQKYVAVALDDFQNAGDLSNSDIALFVNDNTTRVAAATLSSVEPGGDFDDETTRNAWIDYNGNTQTLEVRVANTNTRPTDPLLSQVVDLHQALLGQAPYVGFGAAAGQNVASHNVLSWQFRNCYQPFGESDGGGGGPTNTPPSVSAGGNTSGQEGSGISLNASVSDPDSAQTVTSTWSYEWDPSSPAATKATATCSFFGGVHAVPTSLTCNDNGVVNVTLTATDGIDTVHDSAAVTISNRAPSVQLTAPDDVSTGTTYDVGANVPLGVTVTEPGANDVLTCAVDWGDGSPSGPVIGACPSGHAYAAEGLYTITATLTDDDGDFGSDSVDVDVEAPGDGGGGGSTGKIEVRGGGFIVVVGKSEFAVHADMDKKGRQHGHVDVHTYDKHHFHGTAVTGLTVNGSTASWSGAGTWDHDKGYSYTVQVVDGGEGKPRGPDQIALSIRDPNGALVFSLSGTLSGGNLKVRSKP